MVGSLYRYQVPLRWLALYVKVPLHPANPPIKDKAQDNLEHRGTRDSQPDIEEPPCHFAHEICDRNSDQKSRGNSLEHHKACPPEAVVKPDKAEEEAGQQAVDAVSFQIIETCSDDIGIGGEGSAEQVSMKKGQPKHSNPESSRKGDRCFETLHCALRFPGTVILCDESAHGLHKSGRNEHDEGANFLGDANTC